MNKGTQDSHLDKWHLLNGIEILAFIAKAFSEPFQDELRHKNQNSISSNKRIFISFAIEDEIYRYYLVRQAKLDRSPFTFIDMSVESPWTEYKCIMKCKSKIKLCDEMIVLISKNKINAKAAIWEINCAKDEKIQRIGMCGKKNYKHDVLSELICIKIIDWTCKNLKNISK